MFIPNGIITLSGVGGAYLMKFIFPIMFIILELLKLPIIAYDAAAAAAAI
jgi:hypothetical protein